jgi:hypothetical protein
MTYQNHSSRHSQLRILNRQLQYIKTAMMTVDLVLPDEENWADGHGNHTRNETLVEALHQLQVDMREISLDAAISAVAAALYPAAERATL